jgi:hypothetical protein
VKRDKNKREIERHDLASLICAVINASPNRKRGRGVTPEDLLKGEGAKAPSEQKALALTQMIGGRINDAALEKIQKAKDRAPSNVEMSPKERLRQLREQMLRKPQ